MVNEGILFFVMNVPGGGAEVLLEKAMQERADLLRAPVIKSKSGVAGNPVENIIALDEFQICIARGDFAAQWDDEGWRYGLQAIIKGMLHDGNIFVIEATPYAFATLREAFPEMRSIWIGAKPEALRKRLKESGQYDEHRIDSLLSEAARFKPRDPSVIMIDTSESIEDNLPALKEALEA